MKADDDNEAAIDQIASEWVVRRGTPLSPTEERVHAEWLAVDPRHAAAYARLSRTWTAFDRAEPKGAMEALVTRLKVRARRRRHRMQVAAAIGAIALAVLWFTPRPRSLPAVAVASAAATADATALERVRKLPDGSIVELNRGAEIAVQYENLVRRVRLLEGEAHFRVEKDAQRPFVVVAGGVAVLAVGTAFTVHVAPNAVEVVVTEGRIAVDRAINGDSVTAVAPVAPSTLVDAGHRVLVERTESAWPAAQVEPMTEAAIDARLAWRIPHLEFAGVELTQAAELLNRRNRLQIVLADVAIGRLRVSGVFRSDNPEGFVRIVEATFDLEAQRRGGNEIVLSGR